ncbi:ST4A1 Sulfotransferase, partial [Oxylabes madagascariensis]|nr:ST4A1 Sulfotransferase [Oxylabes madagascariensis]
CLVHAGTGLLQEVVYLVSQGADPDEIGLMNIDEQLPVLEYPQPGLDIIKVQFTANKVFQHLGVFFLGSMFIISFHPVSFSFSPLHLFRMLQWFTVLLGYFKLLLISFIVFCLFLNALLQDLATMVEQLVRFLGVSYDKAQLETMVEHCHQLIDQCCNAEALPVGRGRVGLWKDIFTVSMNEKFDLVYKQKMGKCDLTFDFYL